MASSSNPTPIDTSSWLNQCLYTFTSKDDGLKSPWRVSDAVMGTQVFGATGSGKTSGSGRHLALAMLKAGRVTEKDVNGFGGLVLTAKQDELGHWVERMRLASRSGDLLVMEPEIPHPSRVGAPGFEKPKMGKEALRFNFLDYEFRASAGLTQNLVTLFLSALSTGDQVVSSDPYWNEAIAELLIHAFDLVAFAKHPLTEGEWEEPKERWPVFDLLDVVRVVRTAPSRRDEVGSVGWRARSTCWQMLAVASDRAKKGSGIPPHRLEDFEGTVAYWLHDFPSLNDRTRSIVVSSFTAKVAGLLRSPLRELLCSKTSPDAMPERTHEGKVLLVNLPVRLYDELGRFAQVLVKTTWQRATLRRKLEGEWKPVFLWADESQFFVTEEDMLFQQTARDRMVATVYLTQNLPNYYAALGGKHGESSRVDSLLGNLRTKIFHANADPETNQWAEQLIGRRPMFMASRTESGISAKKEFHVPALGAKIIPLRSGGIENQKLVEGLIFLGGKPMTADDRIYCVHVFSQEGSIQ